MNTLLHTFQVGLVIGWFWLSYSVLSTILFPSYYEIVPVKATFYNPICTTALSCDYYKCYGEVHYTYNEVEYVKKTYEKYTTYPRDGSTVAIEIRKEQPDYVISSFKVGERYHNFTEVTIILSIVIIIINIAIGTAIVCEYLDGKERRESKLKTQFTREPPIETRKQEVKKEN